MSTWMQTYTGRMFYPLAPTLDTLCIEDVAHALSMTCRYGGHSQAFYSVAEHCVLMSEAVSPQHALWALLHDATEAYVGDMVWPLKQDMPAFRELEDRLMMAICHKWGLPGQQPSEVKEADLRIVLTERARLMVAPPQPWPGLVHTHEPLDVVIHAWGPREAEQAYLRRFNQLTKGHCDA